MTRNSLYSGGVGNETDATGSKVLTPFQSAGKKVLSWLVAFVSVCAAGFFALAAVIGARGWTHPIPYWDMWDGHLSFWFQLLDGNTAIWWELSNEHHLLLLKAIFWLDLAVFHGSQAFLVSVNLTLVTGIAAMLILYLSAILREHFALRKVRSGFVSLAAVLIIIPVSWMQGIEIVFPYHAQFLMITLFPLGGFFLLAVAEQRKRRRDRASGPFFWAALALIAATPWVSASGLLVPFVAAALAVALKDRAINALLLAGIGLTSIIVYSIGGPVVGSGESGALSNLLTAPLQVIRFTLLYLGGPWSAITGSTWVAGVSGAVLLAVTVGYLFHWLTSPRRSAIGITVTAFLAFTILSAVITAAGRVNYGEDQVQAIRYLTPVLAAWACLLILAAPSLIRMMQQGSLLVYLPLLLIPLFLLPKQLTAFEPPRNMLQERDTATLAVALGVVDSDAISPVYPISPERPVMLGQRANVEGVGVFSQPPYANLDDRLGAAAPFAPPATCVGWLDSRTPLEGTTLDRINGWLVVDGNFINDGLFPVIASDATIAGFIDVGDQRDDVLAEFPDSGGFSGFSGYLDRSIPSTAVFIASDAFRCSSPLTSAIP